MSLSRVNVALFLGLLCQCVEMYICQSNLHLIGVWITGPAVETRLSHTQEYFEFSFFRIVPFSSHCPCHFCTRNELLLWEVIFNCRSHQWLTHSQLFCVWWLLSILSVCRLVSLHLYSLHFSYLYISPSPPISCFSYSSVLLSVCLSVPFRLTLKPPSGANKAPWHSISCLPRISLLYALFLLF